jgi:hypothetical protein
MALATLRKGAHRRTYTFSNKVKNEEDDDRLQ